MTSHIDGHLTDSHGLIGKHILHNFNISQMDTLLSRHFFWLQECPVTGFMFDCTSQHFKLFYLSRHLFNPCFALMLFRHKSHSHKWQINFTLLLMPKKQFWHLMGFPVFVIIFFLDSFHHYACPALPVAWNFNSSNFPGLLLWIPKTGELSNCRKYVSCKTLPILEWSGPLKFTPVKFGGVGYWMVDKPQISYVVVSWTMSFKMKLKITVKEHLYCISLHGWVGYCMHVGIVFQFGFLLSKPCFLGMYLWFFITPRQILNELGAFYCQWLVLPM